MPGLEKLPLEEAAEDSPQTRTLLGIFYQDAVGFKSYVNSLLDSCKTINRLQTDLSTATQNFSRKLLDFENQKFPLGTDDTVLASTMKQFATIIDEISSWQAVLSTQLSESMVMPLSKFINTDMAEIDNMNRMFCTASNEHDQAMMKYSKLSKKRENETKARIEANEDLYVYRKKFHQTTMNYYSCMNNLQYKRKTVLLEPLLGCLHSQIMHYKTGQEGLSNNLEDFLTNISVSVQSVHSELTEEQQKSQQKMDELIGSSTYFYTPDPTPDMQMRPRAIDTDIKQKAGYLFVRCKQGFSTRWERRYFFTQGGNLMSQPREQFAGALVMDLDKCNIQRADCDDRRYVFQITASNKSTVLLQAESGPDREEWLAAIQNISRENYVNNIPEAALPPSSSSASIPVSQQLPGSRHSDPALQPSSRNESLQPREKGKSRLRTRSRSDSYEPNPAPATPPPSPLDATSLPSIPIQFDMLSPSEDQPTMRSPPREGPPKRINPFSQSATEILSDHVGSTSFSEVYVVRFLGSMEVRSDKGGDVIMETIRQIMAARAIHNVFKMTELQLLITTEMLILLDPSNQGIRSQYALEDVSFFAAHHENNRLFAFITRNKGYTSTMTRFSCSVFECDASGEEICRTLSAAMQVAFQTRLNLKTQGHHAASSSSEAESLSQMSAVTSPVNVDTEAGIPALPMDPNTLTIAAVSLDDKLKLSEGASDIQDSDC